MYRFLKGFRHFEPTFWIFLFWWLFDSTMLCKKHGFKILNKIIPFNVSAHCSQFFKQLYDYWLNVNQLNMFDVWKLYQLIRQLLEFICLSLITGSSWIWFFKILKFSKTYIVLIHLKNRLKIISKTTVIKHFTWWTRLNHQFRLREN